MRAATSLVPPYVYPIHMYTLSSSHSSPSSSCTMPSCGNCRGKNPVMMPIGRLGPGPKAAVTWFLGEDIQNVCLDCIGYAVTANSKRRRTQVVRKQKTRTHILIAEMRKQKTRAYSRMETQGTQTETQTQGLVSDNLHRSRPLRLHPDGGPAGN